jgi:hypothetical protein
MPVINVKVEGTTKMIKSVLVNVEDVCQAIGRPVDCKLYLIRCSSKIDLLTPEMNAFKDYIRF